MKVHYSKAGLDNVISLVKEHNPYATNWTRKSLEEDIRYSINKLIELQQTNGTASFTGSGGFFVVVDDYNKDTDTLYVFFVFNAATMSANSNVTCYDFVTEEF